jgi:hypothetical protein
MKSGKEGGSPNTVLERLRTMKSRKEGASLNTGREGLGIT